MLCKQNDRFFSTVMVHIKVVDLGDANTCTRELKFIATKPEQAYTYHYFIPRYMQHVI